MSRQSAASDNGLVKKLRRKPLCISAFAKFILFLFIRAAFSHIPFIEKISSIEIGVCKLFSHNVSFHVGTLYRKL